MDWIPRALQKGFLISLKTRIDVLLSEKGFFQSREKAQAALMAGVVFVNGQKVDKAGTLVDEEAEILVQENSCAYVSRGGLKLEKAMEEFSLTTHNKICMDIGASTGGFTDCMLKGGAKKVYAIDVGYGQLDWKLRTNPIVINMEKTNIRYLDQDLIEEPVDCISIDVSFISLKLVLPIAARHLSEDGFILALVKPQFEAGRGQVGKNGIVRDENTHIEVIQRILQYARDENLYPIGLTYSPVKGAKGNIEYLLCMKKIDSNYQPNIREIVEFSHKDLK